MPDAAGEPLTDKENDPPTSDGSLGDLAVLLALPAMWVGQEASYIVEDLLRVLFSLLRLDNAYVRFEDPSGGSALEYWRPESSGLPPTFALTIDSEPPTELGKVTAAAATQAAAPNPGTMRTARMYSALPGGNGFVLAGSTRRNFPTHNERYLLQVAVGQATISLRAARMLADERSARVAAEAALETRNAFLARLAHDLTSSLDTLAGDAAKAQDFILESQGDADLDSAMSGQRRHSGPRPAARSHRSRPETGDSADSLPLAINLTRRETEVLRLLAQGLSNKEIAAELWLSDRTVERHLTGLYAKIGVRRRTEATLFALQQGLDDIETGVK